ncbi:MAG: DUF512 domain-containing protein [Lachnospiraceae bacterium]|nr:DUF512 domain-containing protein [Lachnospiraceae bacterium]
MKYTGHKILNIEKGSIAEELEIAPGSYLLEINGQKIEDIFDYQFLIKDEYLEVLIREVDGEETLFEIDKDYDEDLGFDFGGGLMDDYKSCSNKCIFCFIDQMPKGMRETLYFKDDDSRLSFLQGNYITFTNMKDADIDRIIKYRLEPINISVQTTNPILRCKMLNNRFAGDKLKYLDRLNEAQIVMNGQIVLCKNVNDGKELKRSINDLIKYIPNMESVSVVPAGVTKYREGLFPLESFSKEDAVKVIDLIESYQKRLYKEYGTHFIHASDEWYILAGRSLPQANNYDGYLQLENGVGMMRLLEDEVDLILKELESGNYDTSKKDLYKNIEQNFNVWFNKKITIATGVLSGGFILSLINKIKEKYANININVIPIKNVFFGETITVSGLVTGSDIIKQLKNKDLGDELLIPINMLRSGEKVFLDDVTVDDLEKSLNVKLRVVGTSGESFFKAICAIDDEFLRRQIYEQADSSDSRQT